MLQWWDPHAKANLSDRVDGDLIDAIARARQIDQRLADFRRSGRVRRRLTHSELVAAYVADLNRRARAGEVAPATAARYESALKHYVAFTNQPAVTAAYRYATAVDHKFALEFAAYLGTLEIAHNGHPHATRSRMQATEFVLDTVRAMYAWAGDPARGGRLPDGFQNPFLRRAVPRRRVAVDLTSEPDITAAMAAQFLAACDDYQFRLFFPYVFYGLRAAEPVHLFHEFIEDDWLTVPCIPDLDYTTKGRRNKRLPLLPELKALLLRGETNSKPVGLVYQRRAVAAGQERPPLAGMSLADLVAAFEQRRRKAGVMDAFAAAKLRDAVLADVGGTSYDAIQGEFRRVARALEWPTQATLKDFRHLFGTALANGGMPEHERRYLLGHAPGNEAIVTYTHLNKLAEHYRHAIEQELDPALAVLRRRVSECSAPGSDATGGCSSPVD